MKIAHRILSGFLLLAVFLLPPATGFAGGKGHSRGDKVMLSLRIAKARKEQRGIGYYKSVLRQKKSKEPVTARPRSSAR